MAHYCPACEYIFDHPENSCPICGGRCYSDSRPDTALEAEGYLYAPNVTPPGAGVSGASGGDDLYARLESDFQTQYTGRSADPAPVRTPAPGPRADAPYVPPVIPDPTEGDFFGQFGGDDGTDAPDIPQDVGGADVERELREHAAAVRRMNRQVQRERFFAWRGLAPGARRMLGWLVALVVVLLVLGYIWSRRSLIAGAVWDIISALMPSVITVLAIIWLIRALFRGR